MVDRKLLELERVLPRKIRQLREDLKQAGFLELHRRGKGDHQIFQHPDHADLRVQLDGHPGDDAHFYQEKNLARALSVLAEREGR